MEKNNSRWIIGGLVVVALAVLFAWPRLFDPNRELVNSWHAADVDCLRLGHQNLSQHFHPTLRLIIEGKEEPVPGNIGIVRNCMAEVHTHESDGELHIESLLADKIFTLAQFFSVWGKPIEREGYEVTMTVNGEENNALGELVLKDKDSIEIVYEKIEIRE